MISEEEKKLCGLESLNEHIPSNSHYEIRPNYVDLSLNYNCLPYEKNVAIIVTSYHGHLLWLKSTLSKYRQTGAFVICSYDDPFKAWIIDNADSYKSLPPPDIFILPHSWVFKHITYDNDKRCGWFWDVIYAAGIISSFPNIEYVFTVNGDCVWEKPEGMSELISIMGDGDLMSVSREGNTIHTCAVVYKIEAFRKLIRHFTDVYAVPTLAFHSPEAILLKAVKILDLKETIAPEQPMEPDIDSVDHYSRYNQPSTWKNIVGYRNLYAEYITSGIERKEPVEKKFLDERYTEKYCSTAGQQVLLKYYETGDRRYIYQCWDRSEDSWYDRLFYPVEHYGKEPIYSKE